MTNKNVILRMADDSMIIGEYISESEDFLNIKNPMVLDVVLDKETEAHKVYMLRYNVFSDMGIECKFYKPNLVSYYTPNKMTNELYETYLEKYQKISNETSSYSMSEMKTAKSMDEYEEYSYEEDETDKPTFH